MIQSLLLTHGVPTSLVQHSKGCGTQLHESTFLLQALPQQKLSCSKLLGGEKGVGASPRPVCNCTCAFHPDPVGAATRRLITRFPYSQFRCKCLQNVSNSLKTSRFQTPSHASLCQCFYMAPLAQHILEEHRATPALVRHIWVRFAKTPFFRVPSPVAALDKRGPLALS